MDHQRTLPDKDSGSFQRAADSPSPRWMTVEETAHYLGLSKATIYQYVCERRIPYVKIPKSNQVRFDRELVDVWMASGQVKTLHQTLETLLKEGGG